MNDKSSTAKSSGIKTSKIGSGQKIMSAYPQDNAGNFTVKDTMGCAMGGGVTNLGHSLNGASAVQDPHKSNRSGI
jgi:hypothetical protein